MRTTLLAAMAVIVLAGCQGPEALPLEALPLESSSRAVEDRALELIAGGYYAEAADEYVALSREAQGTVAQRMMLRAIGLLLDIGHTDRASSLMNELAGQAIVDELEPRYVLLAADLALRRGAPERTIELLSRAPSSRFGGGSTTKIHRLLARAYEDAGRFLEAARERIALDATLVDESRRAANQSALWDVLSRVERDRLAHELPGATGTWIGWVRLAMVVAERRHVPAALKSELRQWQAEFPAHPANAEIVASMLREFAETIRRPTRIALLLPFGGEFADAAKAIRDGFLASWYSDTAKVQRPAIEIHDTSFESVDVVYARAVEAGADFVVGPLRRSMVTAIACGDPPPVPTLMLNEIDTAESPGEPTGNHCGPEHTVPMLYHFALAPEAEARQVAERAWLSGLGKAIAFQREGGWGERVYRAFAEELERLGGVPLDHRVLPQEAIDIGKPVASALGIDLSQERARNVSRIIGRSVEFEPRRRQDIEFVFAATFPADARQLMPQMAFHHGGMLPVYSTSHVWSGAPDPVSDRDLDRVEFADMPWLVEPAESSRILREQLDTLLAAHGSPLTRLHAFGADAYTLATGLRQIAGEEDAVVDGHTGRLSVNVNRRIVRRLTWARFTDGLPVPSLPEPSNVDRQSDS